MPARTRRKFLQTTAALAAAVSLTRFVTADDAKDEAPVPTPKPYKKAVKHNMVQTDGSLAEKFKMLKDLGFDGIELDSPSGITVEEVLKAKESSGLEVPGVVDSVHWNKRLSDPNPEVRAEGLAALRTAIKFAHDIGATSVLLVPGVVNNEATYEQTWERSIVEIRKALPDAEELKIDVLMENVWNNFLTDPKETARYIDEIDSPRVGAYFDVGNAVRYSPPHEWVPILGKRIKKLDIKDYKLQPEGGNLGAGFGAKLLEGSVDWPKVIAELKKIGYEGWGTAEIQGGGREWLTDVAARMNKIFAG